MVNKKLQLIIPQYDETEDVVSTMFKSIEIQQSIDFDEIGVIVVNDGSDKFLSDEFISSFPYDIQYLKKEHEGVSAARNYGLDHATADYVMFCDADDMFINACGMYIIFREMGINNGFNAMSSVFIEESKDPKTGEHVYLNHTMDSTFVHGKIYNRKYLLDRNIRFNDKLTIHEDSYFNCLAQRLAGEVKYCQQPFYLWRWRDASVCRHDPKYLFKTYINMLDSSTALIHEFMSRAYSDDAQFYATSTIFDAYFMMNKDEWLNQENQEYRNSTERRFKDYYLEFKILYDLIPKETKTQIIVGIKNRFFSEGLLMETITFDDWINHILSIE